MKNTSVILITLGQPERFVVPTFVNTCLAQLKETILSSNSKAIHVVYENDNEQQILTKFDTSTEFCDWYWHFIYGFAIFSDSTLLSYEDSLQSLELLNKFIYTPQA